LAQQILPAPVLAEIRIRQLYPPTSLPAPLYQS
jgi:hypothetical protein